MHTHREVTNAYRQTVLVSVVGGFSLGAPSSADAIALNINFVFCKAQMRPVQRLV